MMRATVVGFVERYPWAAAVFAVPFTIAGLAGVAAFPFLFVPLLVLAGVALVVVEYWADQQREAERRTQPRSTTWPEPHLPQADSATRAQTEAAKARARAAELWAQAQAAEARAVAAEARARELRLRRESEAETERFPRIDYP